ncbi:hypothetical protein BaRGS_00020715 [Batillaria attramentaria]|uniref:Uncharacterized protein n=1 Tax=Batillaria attramentaria TaxID=370345 RepID=A0ABD0KLU4_9CAEN
MAAPVWLLVAVAALVMTSCLADPAATGLGVDSTRVAGASGTDVVLAVVDLIRSNCIFSSDRMFLRRLAYVETKDGTSPDTYKAGYDGGIWKVDKAMFDTTTSCSGYLFNTCNLIRQKFGIDWTHVQWSDLRKPLYSGLGATLYLLQQTAGNQSAIPAGLEEQAMFWTRYYHREGNRANFTLLANETTQFDCNKPLDIAFILDSSGSINDGNFQTSLDFVADVVRKMSVPDYVRVAALIFEDMATIEFNFNTHAHSSKSQILSAITSIVRSSGGTATNVALDLARTTLFSSAHGARDNVARVAVLLTDGQSNSAPLTSAAATRLKKERGVDLFAVGIGGYDLSELMDVASDPKCSHVFTLEDFSQMDSILYEIQTSTCKAHTTLVPRQGPIQCDRLDGCGPVAVPTTTGDNHTTMGVLEVNCGILEIYTSYTNPNPGPAFYGEKFTATDGRPAYITTETNHDGRPLYMTVKGTNLPPNEALLRNCTDFQYSISVVQKDIVVKCCRGSECHQCTPDELRQDTQIRRTVCGNYYEEFPNPCTPEALSGGHIIFKYPYDQNRFIRCDYHGNPFVTLCPNRQTFNPATLTCGYNSPGTLHEIPLPAGYPNPCTPEHIQAQYLYFDYPPDHQLFIHCDLWGNAWLQSCPSLQMWDQKAQTCVADRPSVHLTTTRSPHTFVSPCTPEAEAAGKSFFPFPCDHTRFVHCGVAGAYWIQFCPGGMFFNPETYICVVGDPQHTPECE